MRASNKEISDLATHPCTEDGDDEIVNLDTISHRMHEARANSIAALDWYMRGYNVVPQKATDIKCPGVKWRELQERRVSRSELIRWIPLFAGGVGFITGAISSVVVIETDGPAGQKVLDDFAAMNGPFPTTTKIRSGSGRGLHYHFKYPGHRIKTVANKSIKLDIKGDGGFCVLPPSRHKSGGRYKTVVDTELAELPIGLIEFVETAAACAKGEALPARVTDASSAVRAAWATLSDNVNIPPPLNLTNVAIVHSMLKALPIEFAAEHDLWRDVGFALQNFDKGDVGLALWRKFSEQCPAKAKITDFEACWKTFIRPYHGRRITIWSLQWHATANGWRNRDWDYSTRSVER